MIFIATEVSLFFPFIIVPEGDDEDCSPAFSSRFPRARYGKHIRYVLEHDAGKPPKTQSCIFASFSSRSVFRHLIGHLFGHLIGHLFGRIDHEQFGRTKYGWKTAPLFHMVTTWLLWASEFQIVPKVSLNLVIYGISRLRTKLVFYSGGDFVNTRSGMVLNESQDTQTDII